MKIKELKKYKNRRKTVMVTAYDAVTSGLLERAGVDMILVGDSLGMVVLGYDSTLPVTIDEMVHHAKAVRRGAPRSFIIGDLPYQSVQKGASHALKAAKRFCVEGKVDAVKVEWRRDAIEITRKLVKAGIPVMGHVGLTPQSAHREGGYGVRGKAASAALAIYAQAKAFEKAGAFAVLFECIPDKIAAYITKNLKVPTIGIGAGVSCDGQVLVFHDLVGLFDRFRPKFVRAYVETSRVMEKAVKSFSSDVRRRRFPTNTHSFKMAPAEWQLFLKGAAHAR